MGYNGFYNLSDETGKIVDAHRGDFNSSNVKSFLANKGGYFNYVKSLGGVFSKYYNFSGKVKSKTQLREVAEYVWGLYEIWGCDYSNGCSWTYGDNKYGGKNPFYTSVEPSRRFDMNYACPGFANGNDLPDIDKQLSNPDKYYAVTNCSQGVTQTLKKAGLIGANERCPDSYMSYFKSLGYGYKIIKDAKDLKPGDIMLYYWNEIPRRASKTTIDNWEEGMHHTAIVVKRDNAYIYQLDSGRAYTNYGQPLHRTRIGYWPYEWASDWLGVRFDMIDKLANDPLTDGWVKVGDKWRYVKNGAYIYKWQYLEWSKGKNWFYFNSKGDMVTGWRQLRWSGGEDWFYFDPISGAMVTGLKKLKWSNGKKEDIFYFDPKTGAMVTGKAKTAIKLNFDKNGACTTLKGG